MQVVLRRPRAEDRGEWVRMRSALWPESPSVHDEEITAFLTGELSGWLLGLRAVEAFVAERPGGGLCGFVEASVRPMADGCATQPVGYVEGWYVDPDARRHGVGRGLVEAAERWASSQGCREMASDAHLANTTSIAAHEALGFEAEAPSVRFRKWLPVDERPVGNDRQRLSLIVVEGLYAVCRLDAGSPLPGWAGGRFVSVSRSDGEVSIVCRQDDVPEGIRCERPWRCLRVAGTLDFGVVGVLASLLVPLAAAGVGVFATSTFDTDYLLVKDEDFERAAEALRRAGHCVCPVDGSIH